jgi:hypothetical protein
MTSTQTTAQNFYNLISEMANARKEFAADNGFTATDDEIAESIKASLIRMMSA